MKERAKTAVQREMKSRDLQEKKRHGEPGFPMVVYYNDFSQYVAERVPWHWHKELEFCVVTQGAVEFSVGTDVLCLREGQGIFINADVLHNMVPLETVGNQSSYMFSVLLDAGVLGSSQGALLFSKYVTPYLAEQGVRYELLTAQEDDEKVAVERLREIYEVYMQKGFGYEYRLRNMICEVWFYLVEKKWYHKLETGDERTAGEERIYAALEFIGTHFAQPLSLEEICRAVNISKTEMCRCFKKQLRMTPFEYLMTYRVNTAAGRLENESDTITEIAEKTGFGSNSYFCKQFKRYMGCTPMEYRKRCREKVEQGYEDKTAEDSIRKQAEGEREYAG